MDHFIARRDLVESENFSKLILRSKTLESLVSAKHPNKEKVLDLLDYPSYFDLLKLPLPASRDRIIKSLSDDRLIQASAAGGWDITYLGAILFAKRLADFPRLGRKAVRVVQYRGKDRMSPIKEQIINQGYAAGFEELLNCVTWILPGKEVIRQALRHEVRMYPELAIRELIANALIHQDFLITGAGPMVEVFLNRIEITNPGAPLVSTDRFVDTPPRSRNEAMASMMRRFGICEERGSGIDKVMLEVESFRLPAPLFETPGDFTRSILFAPESLKDMGRRDRIRACYLHACLCYVTHRKMSNATLRNRFGIAEQNSADASRLLKEAVEDGKIVIENPTAGTRNRTYLPFWAGSSAEE